MILKIAKYNKLITLALIPICAFATLICAFGENPIFSNLYLLPLFTGIILIFQLVRMNYQGNISIILISLLYFIRNVIAPVVLVLDGYQSKFNLIDSSNVDNAILIMLWETFTLSLLIKYLSQKTYIKKEKKYIFIGEGIYKLSLLVGVLLSAYALLRSATLRNGFYSIFTSNFYNTGDVVIDSETSALRNGGKVLIDSLRLVIPVTVIVQLRRAYGQKFWNYIISCILAVLQVLFMTDGNMLIILYTIVQLLLIYRIYPRYRKSMQLLMFIMAASITSLMLLHRFLQSDSAYSSSLSVFMQSYLGGVCDVAGIFRLQRENIFSQMLIDYYSTVPFRSTLFGYSGNDIMTVNWYNAVNASHAQILPNIAEGYYFFGYFFSPIYSLILTYISWRVEQRSKTETHFLYYALFTLIYLIAAMSTVMYDMRIFLMDIMNIFIFMWFFIRLSRGVSLYIIGDLENE